MANAIPVVHFQPEQSAAVLGGVKKVLVKVKQESISFPALSFHVVWQSLVQRIQAALIVMQRAWENWVFKSLK